MRHRISNKWILPSVFFSLLLCVSPAFAHGIRVTATVEGKTIHGRVTYQGGTPAKSCTVTGHDDADEVVAKTTTDEEGKFSFEARWRCDYHIEAQTNDGHGGEYVVKASLLPSDLPAREKRPAAENHAAENHGHEHTHQHATADASHSGDESPWNVEQIRQLQAKLNAIQEKLDDQTNSLRLRDILGGIGYIFGVFGLYAIARSNQKKN